MKNKILANLSYWLCAFLGLFQFILFAIPYLSGFEKAAGVRYKYGKLNGYNIMDLWNGGFSGIMSSIFQILILILGIVMLAYGVCGILKSFGIFEQFPDEFKGISAKKYGEFALYGYVGLNFLLLIFLIILTAVNTYTYEDTWTSTTYKAGICLSAGIFLTLIFSIGAAVALKVLEAKFPVTDEETVKTIYVCAECGKKAKKGANFCAECGGKVEEKTVASYVCEQCGKSAKKNEKFCSECGGKIVEKGNDSVYRVCEKCGKKGGEGAFCAECGGKIVTSSQAPALEEPKEDAQDVQEAQEAEVTQEEVAVAETTAEESAPVSETEEAKEE